MNRQLIEVNASFCKMFGYSRPDMLSLPVDHWTHPDDRGRHKKENDELINGEIPVLRTERSYIHKSGAVLTTNLTGSIVRDGNGEPLYAVVILEDITERKKAEEKQRRIDSTLRLMADHATDVIYRVRFEPWRYDYISPSCKKTFG